MKWVEKDLGNIEQAYIIPISDLHIGDGRFQEDKFIKLRNLIMKTPNCYVVLVGDILNNATKNSVSDVYSEKLSPSAAKKYAVELLTPLKSRILGAVSGNHEHRTKKESDIDIMEDVADKLNIDYESSGLLLNVRLGNNGPGKFNYFLYCTHGTGGGSTPGGKANAVYKGNKIVLADIYVIGHVHNMMTYPDIIYVPDTTHRKVVEMKRQYVVSGSYLDWGGYSERYMLAPGKNGSPIITISGKKKSFHVSI